MAPALSVPCDIEPAEQQGSFQVSPAANPTLKAGADHQELLFGMESSPKSIPCSYLYDAHGSELYDQITNLPEYYPYRTELQMLRHNAPSIIEHIQPGSVIVELGCGSATKTSLILNALLDRDGPHACYFEGIDCSSEFLQSARQNLLSACPELLPSNLGTICSLYLEGLKEARRRHPHSVLCILWLGSSVGNLDNSEALHFFQEMLHIGGGNTQVFVCTDLWKDAATLHAAYHDSQSVTERFIKNGLSNALGALGVDLPSQAKTWTYDVVVNADLQQVEMWLVAPNALTIPGSGITIAAGERVLMEVSRKFTQLRLRNLACQAGWAWQAAWANKKYSMQMLCAPELALEHCWADTDALFASMPDWASHPITIRHPFCFYYGHVAAFAKLKLLPEGEVQPWDEMFSRGIDPDVLDPSQCHKHPNAPAQWPTKQEILDYSLQVRQQLLGAVRDGHFDRRGLYIALEHERMHQETLAYMQAQQRRISFEAALNGRGMQQAVTATGQPHANGHGAANGQLANGIRQDGTTHAHAPSGGVVNTVANGHGPASENGESCTKGKFLEMNSCPGGPAVRGVDLTKAGFVWDNEGPQQEPVTVPAFAAAVRPVTVGEYRHFILEQHGYSRAELWHPGDFKHLKKSGQQHPATWTMVGTKVWVHTNTATKFWTEVKDEPVWVSLAEAEAFCAAHGSYVMSEPEYLRLLEQDEACGQQRWHKLRTGGWEWTTSEFSALHGFQAMPEYPEYSADFFDGKHMVLKGSAHVTHASLIRDSFRNFYQRQYPFMFAKFRCCMSVGD